MVLVLASILMVKSSYADDVSLGSIPRTSMPPFSDKCKITIYGNKTTVDCSNAGLKAIPRVPWNVTVLKLSGNTLRLIKSKAFGFRPLLETLHLDRCKITTIARLAFMGLPMLAELNLDSNNFHDIPKQIFHTIPSLQKLTVSNNCGLFSNDMYLASGLHKLTELHMDRVCVNELPVDMFQSNTRLRIISLNNNHLLEVPMAVAPLDQLRILELMGNRITSLSIGKKVRLDLLNLMVENNRIIHLKSDDFANYSISKSMILNLAGNKIGNIDDNIFEKTETRFFRLLSLALNPIGNQNIRKLFSSFKRNRVKVHKCILQKTGLDLLVLNGTFLADLKTTSLRHLDLSLNKILYIRFNAFDAVPNLKYLSLKNTGLTAFETPSNGSLLQLEQLQLDQNLIHDIRSVLDITAHCRSLKSLHLSKNELHSTSLRVKFPVSNLSELDLSLNFKQTNLKQFDFTSLRSLRKLNIHGILIPGSYFNMINLLIQNLTFLEWLDFSTTQSFIYSAKTEEITTFQGCIRLKHLSLSNNNFYRSSSEHITQLLSPLHNLQYLGLGANQMHLGDEILPQSLDKYTFRSLPSLQILSLADNFLTKLIPGMFSKQKHLKKLSLQTNHLRTIHRDDLRGLNSLKDIGIARNPFNCDCDIRWFSNFLYTTHLKVEGAGIKCTSPKDQVNTKVRNFSPTWLACDNHIMLLVLIVGGGVLIVFTMVALVIYYRWDIRFWYVMHRARQNVINVEPLIQDERPMQHLAFVSHNSEDEAWINEHLIPNIERAEDTPFELCTSGRDFIPGKPIVQNIADCVTNCSRLIFVVTRQFLESDWCIFEVEMALQKILDDRQGLMILLFLENIKRKDLPKHMQLFCKHVTYLEWPDTVRGQEVFWKRLKLALSGFYLK